MPYPQCTDIGLISVVFVAGRRPVHLMPASQAPLARDVRSSCSAAAAGRLRSRQPLHGLRSGPFPGLLWLRAHRGQLLRQLGLLWTRNLSAVSVTGGSARQGRLMCYMRQPAFARYAQSVASTNQSPLSARTKLQFANSVPSLSSTHSCDEIFLGYKPAWPLHLPFSTQ